jgi:CDP-4-dehydro-6-deoxyglucose reductase
MSLLPWHTAVVKEIHEHNAHTRSYFLASEDVSVFDFKPGQFVTFDLPIADRPSQRMRSYSIASAPNGDNTFELVITHKPNGAGSGYFFDACTIGHQLKYRGPQGNFVLPESLDRPMALICTGTGVAPFRSQVRHLLLSGIPTPEIHLVFGTRTLHDALYADEFDALAKEYSQFHYHLTLSRPDHHWKGRKGYVHEIYTEICQQGQVDMDFYLCGWRMMINEARTRLQELGYPKERVHLEVYD